MRRVLRGAFLASSLSDALETSHLSRLDKGFVTDLCYGTLRHLRVLDCSLEDRLSNAGKLPEAIINILRLASYELLIKKTAPHAAINEWVEISKAHHKKLGGLVNAVLRRVELAQDLNPAVKHSMPDWLYTDWLELFPQHAPALAKSMNEPEPFWLYSYKSNAREVLEAEGTKVESGPFAHTWAVQANQPLHHLQAFQQGLVGAQNPSSSLIPTLLNIEPGEKVLDLASGNGIKTAQLISLGAKVTSVELSAKKVKRAEANLARLGYRAHHLVHNLETLPALALCKKVLLDAPCSGTGTLRGHPEIKLRISPEDVETLAHLQTRLLETAWQLTEPGGTLIYAICALTSKESIGVIEGFLQRHKTAKVKPLELTCAHHMTAFGTYILPFAGLDGFFISKLEKSHEHLMSY